MEHYECDRCGACCQGHLLVEVYEIDVLREPRLATADTGRHYAGMTLSEVLGELADEYKCLLIAGGVNRPCKFLGADKLCQIYPTRPNACVGMAAGDEQCQMARSAAGLPEILPVAAV